MSDELLEEHGSTVPAELPPAIATPQYGVHREIILGGNDFTIRSVQDATPFLDHNKRLQNDGTDGYSPSRELKRVASIPPIVAEKWLTEEGIDVFNRDHWPAVKRKLNSSDYMWLRTSGGRI
jgi:hypothetical protein